jgi:hypothetical protein
MHQKDITAGVVEQICTLALKKAHNWFSCSSTHVKYYTSAVPHLICLARKPSTSVAFLIALRSTVCDVDVVGKSNRPRQLPRPFCRRSNILSSLKWRRIVSTEKADLEKTHLQVRSELLGVRDKCVVQTQLNLLRAAPAHPGCPAPG